MIYPWVPLALPMVSPGAPGIKKLNVFFVLMFYFSPYVHHFQHLGWVSVDSDSKIELSMHFRLQ